MNKMEVRIVTLGGLSKLKAWKLASTNKEIPRSLYLPNQKIINNIVIIFIIIYFLKVKQALAENFNVFILL